MSNYIISIGRQHGCGGRELSMKLSEKLGIPYYDKEIMQRAAKDQNMDENVFAFYDERATRSFLYNVTTDGFGSISNNGMSFEDQVFQYQFETIKKYAQEGSCIILGRCSDYILKDNPNLLTVFVHADDEYRIDRAKNVYEIKSKNIIRELRVMDKKRAKFHNFYSDSKWGDALSYDLCVNVSKIGIDETVDLIVEYVNKRFNNI